jgi:O-antigen ligase
MNKRLQATVALIAVAVLPLDFQPLGFEAHEPYRAGLLLLLICIVLPTLRLPRTSPLLIAIILWCLALLVSTVFALSPARALAGDLIRKMGLLTQLALVGGAFLVVSSDSRDIGRWLWWAGVIAASYVCLQVANLVPGHHLDHRPQGPLGVATFTAGWLTLAILWAGMSIMREPFIPRRTLLFAVGIGLMLTALILTEARGAALALFSGITTGGLIGTATHCARRFALMILVMGLLVGLALVIASRLDWRDTSLSRLPLIARLNPNEPDLPRQSREAIWDNALILSSTWPRMTDIHGQADPWRPLRPILGYGLESFEFVHRPLMRSEQAIDRAHNDWLDTLVMMGWSGVIARTALWIGALWVGLNRLHMNVKGAWLSGSFGLLAAALFFAGSPLLPIALTFGAIGGFWLWLVARAWLPAPSISLVPVDHEAWLALAVLTAYLVDLQFSFVTVAVSWPAWLAFGLLLKSPPTSAANEDEPAPKPALAALSIALLLRSLILINVSWLACLIIFAILIVATMSLISMSRRGWLWIAGGCAAGLLGSRLLSPVVVALFDTVLILAALSLLIWPIKRPTQMPIPAVLCRILLPAILFLVLLDRSADIYLARALETSAAPAVTEIELAAAFRPWDDRLLAAAGNLELRAAAQSSSPAIQVWLNRAQDYLEQATDLNGYDANYAYLLALTEEQLALINPNANPHLERADSYFDAATRLWPNQSYFWREWARFVWTWRGDAVSASAYLNQTLILDPQDQAAQDLLAEITLPS